MQTNDRELLELAAKAAGIPIHVWGAKGRESVADMSDPSNHKLWNPLTDDGDLLRLMVGLSISLHFDDIECTVEARHPQTSYGQFEEYGADKGAATRRAGVRAAAELIGSAA